LVNNSADTGDVLHSVLEKNEIHSTDVLVVFFHFALKSLLKLIEILYSSVRRIMSLASIDERCENKRRSKDDSVCKVR